MSWKFCFLQKLSSSVSKEILGSNPPSVQKQFQIPEGRCAVQVVRLSRFSNRTCLEYFTKGNMWIRWFNDSVANTNGVLVWHRTQPCLVPLAHACLALRERWDLTPCLRWLCVKFSTSIVWENCPNTPTSLPRDCFRKWNSCICYEGGIPHQVYWEHLFLLHADTESLWMCVQRGSQVLESAEQLYNTRK